MKTVRKENGIRIRSNFTRERDKACRGPINKGKIKGDGNHVPIPRESL